MRFSLFAVFALLLVSCAEFSMQPGYVLVKSDPEGALLTFASGKTCQTPCQVYAPEPVSLTVGRAGYKAQNLTIFADEDRVVLVTMELAAPTTEVEADALPEL